MMQHFSFEVGGVSGTTLSALKSGFIGGRRLANGVIIGFPLRTVKTKNAARKRYRVTGKGDIKCFPSRLNGTSRRLYVKEVEGGYAQLKKTLPNYYYRHGSIKLTVTRKEKEKDKKEQEEIAARCSTTEE